MRKLLSPPVISYLWHVLREIFRGIFCVVVADFLDWHVGNSLHGRRVQKLELVFQI